MQNSTEISLRLALEIIRYWSNKIPEQSTRFQGRPARFSKPCRSNLNTWTDLQSQKKDLAEKEIQEKIYNITERP